jgi:hypothetical protein
VNFTVIMITTTSIANENKSASHSTAAASFVRHHFARPPLLYSHF